MINAWSLLYDELNGTMDENFPIKKKEDGDVTPCKLEDIKITSLESDEYDPIVTVGSGNTDSASTNTYFVDSTDWENIKIDTSNCPVTLTGLSTDQIYTTPPIEEPICTTTNLDDLVFNEDYYDTLNINLQDDYPAAFSTLADNDDSISHHVTTPGIETDNPRKYKEDESIQALQNYISTTYGGHYTSDNNNVQTLDLIESVGDAESFCRSNAIKYLSRYDKKGQAKRDILKALHYSLLLYHFSGQLNETTTRGYETF
jgi:hypothetical protein